MNIDIAKAKAELAKLEELHRDTMLRLTGSILQMRTTVLNTCNRMDRRVLCHRFLATLFVGFSESSEVWVKSESLQRMQMLALKGYLQQFAKWLAMNENDPQHEAQFQNIKMRATLLIENFTMSPKVVSSSMAHALNELVSCC